MKGKGKQPTPVRKRAVFQKKLDGALYDLEKKLWIAPRVLEQFSKKEQSKFINMQWFTEKARSDRSTCRRCGQKINKDDFRIAYPSFDHRAEFGCRPSWLHMGCAASALAEDDDLARGWNVKCLHDVVIGYKELSKADKTLFLKQISTLAEEDDSSNQVVKTPPKAKIEPMEPPSTVKANLFPYQKEGLAWMVQQEKDPGIRGGILADEMGMGKTLQAICTMLTCIKVTLVVCPSAAVLQWRNEILRFSDGALKPLIYHGEDRNMHFKNVTDNTVIITTYQTLECEYRRIAERYKLKCEWCDRLFLPDKLAVHQKYFCGPTAVRTKAQSKTERKDEAVQMMRVGGVETEIQLHYPLTALRSVMQKDRSKKKKEKTEADETIDSPDKPSPKKSMKKKGKTEKKEEIEADETMHSPDKPSPDELVNSTNPPKKRLSLVPNGKGWNKKLKTSNKVVDISTDPFCKKEIDLCASSSENEVALVGRKGKFAKPIIEDWGDVDLSSSLFFNQKWGRVILDEAHRIKSRTNSTATAAFCLQAEFRWCITGTPLQNKIGELYSLVRFLKFYPYAFYRCVMKDCGCESLHYRYDAYAKCVKCKHMKMKHVSVFQQEVSGPITRYGDIGMGKTAFQHLHTDILTRIMLRRTKLERAEDLNLPPMHVRIRRDALSKEELDFYHSMFKQCVTEFGTYVDQGTLLHNYAHVFDLLMRLRQAVDHPYLIVHGSLKAKLPTQSRSKAGGICSLCQDGIQTGLTAKCGHHFHKDCVQEYLGEAPVLACGGVGCPSCFTPLTIDFDAEEDFDEIVESTKKKKSMMDNIDPEKFQSSTKIEALMDEIEKMNRDPTSKALVFSQFIRFLDLIEWRLKRACIGCAKVTGAINIQARNNIIMDFNTNPNMKVLLISLKAGGEGLNLQAANHVFLMDPWWNPAAELQAMQRAHRIGQTRELTCTRFFAADTIEDRIMSLQKKKQIAFDVTVENKTESLAALTSDDLMFLFQK